MSEKGLLVAAVSVKRGFGWKLKKPTSGSNSVVFLINEKLYRFLAIRFAMDLVLFLSVCCLRKRLTVKSLVSILKKSPIKDHVADCVGCKLFIMFWC